MESVSGHIPVLINETVTLLQVKHGMTIVDATGGGGGHSARILELIGADGTLIILDQDPVAVEALKKRFHDASGTVHVVCKNFRFLEEVLDSLQITHVDGILADLGWNSDQFAHGLKGFSFQNTEPLLMTFGDPATHAFTAADIVNEWREESIADVLYGYADERYALRIAKKICESRIRTPIRTTDDLVALIKEATPRAYQYGRIHPATKTFQALRIAVNDELDALGDFLKAAELRLAAGGRVGVIAFHSIEDRIVKHAFKVAAESGVGTIITKKPVIATKDECAQNPRARSAKLRILEKNDTSAH